MPLGRCVAWYKAVMVGGWRVGVRIKQGNAGVNVFDAGAYPFRLCRDLAEQFHELFSFGSQSSDNVWAFIF